jgi:hypothetical protein
MPMNREERHCSNCIYSFPSGQDFECRFKKPTGTGQSRGSFPMVRSDWWCGDGLWEKKVGDRTHRYSWDDDELAYTELIPTNAD